MLRLFLLIILLGLPTTGLWANEVDDHYCNKFYAGLAPHVAEAREKAIEKILNEFTQKQIIDAVEARNKWIVDRAANGKGSFGCDGEPLIYFLFKSIKKRLASSIVSELENEVHRRFSGKYCNVPLKKSIYWPSKKKLAAPVSQKDKGSPSQNLSFWKRLENTIYKATLRILDVVDKKGEKPVFGDSIKMCGSVFGTDKLGHFFDDGLRISRESHLNRIGFSSRSAYYAAKRLEDGPFGIKASGVMSRGDIAADMAGSKFYSDILLEKKDDSGAMPLITCKKVDKKVAGTWLKVPQFFYDNEKHPFKWCDYVDDSWDESLNCSSYGEVELEVKGGGNVKKLRMAGIVKTNMKAKGYKCPRDPTACAKLKGLLRQKYDSNTARLMLSKECYSAVAPGANSGNKVSE